MEDVFDATWQSATVAGSHSAESELASLIDIFGLTMLDEPERIAELLAQACPDVTQHVDALVAALRAGVPKRLRGAQNDDALPALLQRSARHLQTQAGLDAGWAMWAVRAWAHALALPTEGLGRAPTAATTPAARPDGDGFDDDAFVIAPPIANGAKPAGNRTPAVAPPPASTPERLQFRADRTAAARDGAAERPPRDTTTRREPVLVDRSDDDAALPDAAEPPMLIEPLFSDREAARVAVRPVGPIGLVGVDSEVFATPATAPAATAGAGTANRPEDDAAAPPVIPPMLPPPWQPPSREAHASRPRSGPGVIGAALLAVAIVAAAAVWFAGGRSGGGATPSTTSSPTAAPATPSREIASSAATPSASPAAASPAAASPPAAATDQPESSGRGSPDAVPEPTAAATPAPTASPAPVAAEPVAPAPTAPPKPVPPVIARIDVPQVVEGAPFTVVLRVGGDVRDVASVERRIVASRGIWPRNGVLTPSTGLRTAGGALLVPFRGMDAPAYATIEFTAIARDGTRSAPKAATVTVAETLSAPGVRGPLSFERESTGPCTAATCGTVIEARELVAEFDTRTPVYQVVVRMDDRQTRAFTAAYRLQAGSRVRMVDGRVVPIVDGGS